MATPYVCIVNFVFQYLPEKYKLKERNFCRKVIEIVNRHSSVILFKTHRQLLLTRRKYD